MHSMLGDGRLLKNLINGTVRARKIYMAQTMSDVWGSGVSYEAYVGRWSRIVAREFVNGLAVPAQAHWLDVGCGTGALTETILAVASPSTVLGIDPAQPYVAFARAHVHDPRASFRVSSAMALAAQAASYDAAVSGLVLNFVPRAETALSEMARVTRPGAVVAAYVWDYAEGMSLMRCFWDAAVALDPSKASMDEGRRFLYCRPEPLAQLFKAAGLYDVEVRAITIPTIFRDFDDYWYPFLGGEGPAGAYAISLKEEDRAALRERIRASLPIEPDGSIHLTARAWAARGTR
jgi:SAM-dependent methyltransferase